MAKWKEGDVFGIPAEVCAIEVEEAGSDVEISKEDKRGWNEALVDIFDDEAGSPEKRKGAGEPGSAKKAKPDSGKKTASKDDGDQAAKEGQPSKKAKADAKIDEPESAPK
eukprot:gene1527-5085_t